MNSLENNTAKTLSQKNKINKENCNINVQYITFNSYFHVGKQWKGFYLRDLKPSLHSFACLILLEDEKRK